MPLTAEMRDSDLPQQGTEDSRKITPYVFQCREKRGHDGRDEIGFV